jgi:hypothetical protein
MVNIFIQQLEEILTYGSYDTFNLVEKLAQGDDILQFLNIIIDSIIVIIMILCFFSLSSSMSANIF